MKHINTKKSCRTNSFAFHIAIFVVPELRPISPQDGKRKTHNATPPFILRGLKNCTN